MVVATLLHIRIAIPIMQWNVWVNNQKFKGGGQTQGGVKCSPCPPEKNPDIHRLNGLLTLVVELSLKLTFLSRWPVMVHRGSSVALLAWHAASGRFPLWWQRLLPLYPSNSSTLFSFTVAIHMVVCVSSMVLKTAESRPRPCVAEIVSIVLLPQL